MAWNLSNVKGDPDNNLKLGCHVEPRHLELPRSNEHYGTSGSGAVCYRFRIVGHLHPMTEETTLTLGSKLGRSMGLCHGRP